MKPITSLLTLLFLFPNYPTLVSSDLQAQSPITSIQDTFKDVFNRVETIEKSIDRTEKNIDRTETQVTDLKDKLHLLEHKIVDYLKGYPA